MKNAIVTKAWINKTVQIYAEAGFVSAYIDIFYVGNFCRGGGSFFAVGGEGYGGDFFAEVFCIISWAYTPRPIICLL